MTIETMLYGAVIGIGGGILLIALFALLSRLNAPDDDDPPTIVVMDAEEIGDVVDTRGFYRQWDDEK